MLSFMNPNVLPLTEQPDGSSVAFIKRSFCLKIDDFERKYVILYSYDQYRELGHLAFPTKITGVFLFIIPNVLALTEQPDGSSIAFIQRSFFLKIDDFG